MTRLLRFATACLMALALTGPGFAQSMDAPTGDVVLTITGDIGITNVGDTLQLDREQLAAIGVTEVKTSTIWTDDVHSFEGVSLLALVTLLGVESGTLQATAVNDYTVDIPVSDAIDGGPILASKMDGKIMSLRNRGPLWVIYPFDSSADYRAEVIYARSIWQLNRINVVQ